MSPGALKPERSNLLIIIIRGLPEKLPDRARDITCRGQATNLKELENEFEIELKRYINLCDLHCV
jgi:hypothetical protein